jgi:hypothetical protein
MADDSGGPHMWVFPQNPSYGLRVDLSFVPHGDAFVAFDLKARTRHRSDGGFQNTAKHQDVMINRPARSADG